MNPFSRGMGPSVVRRNVMMGPIDAPLALPRLLDGGRGGGGCPARLSAAVVGRTRGAALFVFSWLLRLFSARSLVASDRPPPSENHKNHEFFNIQQG